MKWNSESKEWEKHSSHFDQEPIKKDKITNLTFNVLTDMFGTKPFRTHVIHSAERYESTLKDIGEIQPDMISFN